MAALQLTGGLPSESASDLGTNRQWLTFKESATPLAGNGNSESIEVDSLVPSTSLRISLLPDQLYA